MNLADWKYQSCYSLENKEKVLELRVLWRFWEFWAQNPAKLFMIMVLWKKLLVLSGTTTTNTTTTIRTHQIWLPAPADEFLFELQVFSLKLKSAVPQFTLEKDWFRIPRRAIPSTKSGFTVSSLEMTGNQCKVKEIQCGRLWTTNFQLCTQSGFNWPRRRLNLVWRRWRVIMKKSSAKMPVYL